MPPEYYGQREAVHFLSPQKTGLDKIREGVINLVVFQELVIGAISHLFRKHSADGSDSGTCGTGILLIHDAPALRDQARGRQVGVLFQMICEKKMHGQLLAIINRVAPSSTNTLCISAGTNIPKRPGRESG
jgi:hypothetical protein